MRKATFLTSSFPHSSSVTTHRSSYQKSLFSTSIIRNYHADQQFDGGQLQHQALLRQLLRHCSRVKLLGATKSLHALSITMGPYTMQPIFLNNNIIVMYATQGNVSLARQLFDEMPHRNAVSYNTIIGAYSRVRNVEEAWELFSQMRYCGFEPTQFTFSSLLSCACPDICRGFYLQALIIKSGLLYSDAFAGTALLSLFGRHEFLDEAIRAFEDMPGKNLVTWNSLISLLGHHGYAEECVLMFRDLELGGQIHGLVIKNGLEFVVSVSNALINMYAKCSVAEFAEKIFEDAPVWDIVSWNTRIGALARSDRHGKAVELFLEMHVNGNFPNKTTFVTVINACARLQIPIYGEFVHAKIIRKVFESDVYIGSALVDFYAKCDRLEDAHRCFDKIREKNLVSWNALLAGYANKDCLKSFSLLREMIQLGYLPNEVSFSSVVKSSFVLGLQQIHSLIIRMGYHQNEYVSSSLITSFAKNGLTSDALKLVAAADMPLPVVPSNVVAGVYNRTGQYHKTQELFSSLEEPDLVSWNILIAACARNGDYKEVFELFEHMKLAHVCPDSYTYVSLLNVCTKVCNLGLGCSLHGLMIKADFNRCDTFVCNVIIDMYGKCGSLESAFKVFKEMTVKNVVTWTALVSALGLHGRAHEALERFREMEMVRFKPDRVAFLAVLSACRHVGLVKEGMELFKAMKMKYGVEPEMDHYLLVVDLLARYGSLKEAERLICGMPFPPNALIWRSFLEGCKRKRTTEDLALNM
ncbi:hypothetical protein RJ639_012248 [Escallonia herrerae]|uniref:Pentatricopeptide repeat-containing protein n=1 Tax=Escallonia herrerae TaxID=1293975 RepID=A0AA88VJW0_9ASTE|nr:hypothetical protein RJ639_012248 [Escallonia herrerae]